MKMFWSGVLFALVLPLTAGAEVIPPDQVVRDTTTELQTVIGKRQAEFKQDPAKLYAVMDTLVVPRFDLRYIAQLILAQHWRKATDDQRERFQVAFKKMLMHTYADALVEYHDSVKAEWQPLELEAEAKNVTVQSRLLRDNGPPIPIGFAMRLKDGEWKVYDIIIENLSLVTNFRSQVASEIRKIGIDALILKLEKGELAKTSDGQ